MKKEPREKKEKVKRNNEQQKCKNRAEGVAAHIRALLAAFPSKKKGRAVELITTG